MTSAQMRFDAWRTEQASNRQMDKLTKWSTILKA
jgi:hypothetical protein